MPRTSRIAARDVIERNCQQPVTSVNEFKQVVAGLDQTHPRVSMCRNRVRSFIVCGAR